MELYLIITKSQLTIKDLRSHDLTYCGHHWEYFTLSVCVFDQWTASERWLYSKQSPVKPKCFLVAPSP